MMAGESPLSLGSRAEALCPHQQIAATVNVAAAGRSSFDQRKHFIVMEKISLRIVRRGPQA
jgi:hypothetical protein